MPADTVSEQWQRRTFSWKIDDKAATLKRVDKTGITVIERLEVLKADTAAGGPGTAAAASARGGREVQMLQYNHTGFLGVVSTATTRPSRSF